MYIRCRRSNTSWKRRAELHDPSAAQAPLASGLRARGEPGLFGEWRGKSPPLPAIPLAFPARFPGPHPDPFSQHL